MDGNVRTESFIWLYITVCMAARPPESAGTWVRAPRQKLDLAGTFE